jgi:hypothetical protein
MSKEPEQFVHSSTQTTGGDPIEGVDPGGTRSTRPGQADKTDASKPGPKVEQRVESGDRNPKRESRTPQP